MGGAAEPAWGERIVSRETQDRLQVFVQMVLRYNARINLVSPGDTERIWERHVMDSLQLMELAPDIWTRWVDLGSGGGFPGLVVAIAARELTGKREVVLVESDGRKAEFLREAAAIVAPGSGVLGQRIETATPLRADVVSARALSALPILLGQVHRHLSEGGVALLPKGRRAKAELSGARTKWAFDAECIPSRANAEAVVLRIRSIERI